MSDAQPLDSADDAPRCDRCRHWLRFKAKRRQKFGECHVNLPFWADRLVTSQNEFTTSEAEGEECALFERLPHSTECSALPPANS